MSKLGIPWIVNIPIEDSMKIDKELDIDGLDIIERTTRIKKLFKNKKSRIKQVADYLYEHLDEELSYKKISLDLEIPTSTVKLMVCDLNFYNGFSITMIPVKKKKGYIQSVLDSEEDYERWDKTKRKTITSMTFVRNKAEKITHSKRRTRKKVKIKNETQMS